MRRGRYLPFIAALWVVSLSICSLFVFGTVYVIRSGGVYFASESANVSLTPGLPAAVQDAPSEIAVSQEQIYTQYALVADEYIRLALGETVILSVPPSDGAEYDASPKGVVTVSSYGAVTGISTGKTLVSVKTGGETKGGDGIYRCVVTVHEPCPESALLDVPLILQGEEYPNGCESVSAVMALRYAGIPITVDNFVDRYLDHDYFTFDEEKPWIRYGKSPWTFYNGDPADASGTYCYAPTIEAAMNKFVDREKYNIDMLYGGGLMELCTEYILRGIPVVVWETVDMAPVYDFVTVWYDEVTGQRYRLLLPVHCMVLVGYDADGYYFNDPLVGKSVYYTAEEAERAYESMWAQAIAVYDPEREYPAPGDAPERESESAPTDETDETDTTF